LGLKFNGKKKKGNWNLNHSPNPKVNAAAPSISKSMKPSTIWIIAAIIAIRNALPHPQSKKCLTRASQRINDIIAPIMPEKKAPRIAPITDPRTTIQTASLNLAFSAPTKALPASQTNSEFATTLRTMLITT